jgi:hypothetical protein
LPRVLPFDPWFAFKDKTNFCTFAPLSTEIINCQYRSDLIFAASHGISAAGFFVEVPMSNRNSRHSNQFDSMPFEKMRHGNKSEYHRENPKDKSGFSRFRCLNCSLEVTAEHELSGVNNRNHCPNCLWSKHVDLVKAGDRKCTCNAGMKPIGLTVKKVAKKYGDCSCGELMIIHQCSGCGKISINRIAADDSAGVLLQLYQTSLHMESETKERLSAMDIQPLAASDLTTVYSQLFGWQSILEEFTVPADGIALIKEQESADEDRWVKWSFAEEE